MSKRDSLKCIPIEKLSTATIFKKYAPKGVEPTALGEAILPKLNFVKGSNEEKARYYYCLAYGHYRMGINRAILEEVLDNAENGLQLDPEPDVKVGLVFLKVISLFQLARELIQLSSERDRTKDECNLIKSTIATFKSAAEEFQNGASIYDHSDLIEKIQDLKDKIWPSFT